jgi:hypothetical protein
MSRAPARTVAPALFLISAATLLLQIGLTRVFAYTIWYHFAFLVIAAALLGYGASGSALLLWGRLQTGGVRQRLAWLAAATAAATALTSIWITRVPLDPFRMTEDPSEAIGLLSYLIAVTTPFFFAGCAVAVALSSYPASAGRLYFADLLGAALACALVVVLMNAVGPRWLLVVCVALDVIAALIVLDVTRTRLAALGAVALALAAVNASVGDFTPADSKLAAKYADAGGEIVYSRWSAVFRTDLYDFHDVLSLRSDYSLTVYGAGIGGVGKTFAGKFPPYRFIAHDGDASAIMVRSTAADDTADFLRRHLLGLSYRFKPGARVFMGGVGGGIDLLSALAGGATRVHGVELDPHTVDIVCREHAEYVGGACGRPGVRIEAGDARSVVRRSTDTYDIVNFTSVDTITTAATGMYLLSEGYLYTVEAMTDYLDRLAPGGIVSIISGDVGGPWGLPRWIPRIASVAASALEARGVTAPADHVVIIGTSLPEGSGLSHEAVFVKNEPFTAEELGRLDAATNEEGFLYWHRPGRKVDTAASTLLRLDPVRRAEYFDSFHLDYRAPTDDKPFFMHFYKWDRLFSNLRFDARYVEATGNVVLLAGLAFAILGAAGLIAVPAWIAARRERRSGVGAKRRRAPLVAYFAALGIGFMFIEIALVQRLVLLLGYPTYSLTVTLFSLLAFAATGSYLTRELSPTRRNALRLALALTALAAVHFVVGDAIERALLPAPLAVRALAAVALMAPLGVLLGAFLPLGIRALGESDPAGIPLAWAANGTTSVVGTVLSVILATVIGFRGVFVIALGTYWLAVLAFPEPRRGAPVGPPG